MKNKRLFPQFPLTFWLSFCFFIGITIAFYFFIVSWGKADQEKYWSLMKNANPRHANPETSPYTAMQQRLHAQKDVWFNKKDKRLQLRVKCLDSQLVFDHHDNATEIIEKMKEVKSFIQEELYYVLPDKREVVRRPNGVFQLRQEDQNNEVLVLKEAELKSLKPMQIVRYMEAKEAEYNYQTDSFVARRVKIFRYLASGHEMKESLANSLQMTSGEADAIEVSLKDNDFKFKAHQMKAKMHFPIGML